MTDKYNKEFPVFRIEYSIKDLVKKSVALVSEEDKEEARVTLEIRLKDITMRNPEEFSFLGIEQSKRLPSSEKGVMYPSRFEDIVDF